MIIFAVLHRLNDCDGVESGCHCPNVMRYVTGLANHDAVVVSARAAAVEILRCTIRRYDEYGGWRRRQKKKTWVQARCHRQ